MRFVPVPLTALSAKGATLPSRPSPARSNAATKVAGHGDAGVHFKVLDGWRGISIVLVLIAHLVPLGRFVNTSIGIAGMALFFTLSGFLITSFLLKKDATVPDFLIRRFFRIVPLAVLYMLVVFAFQTETLHTQFEHFFFVANLPPQTIRESTDHLWSLCVEVQFYVGIVLLFWAFRQRGLLLLPLLALAFTGLRVVNGVESSSITWFRIDEILAGCTLALLHHGAFGSVGDRLVAWLRVAPQKSLCVLLMLCSLYEVRYGGWLSYLRPYVAALLVGSTLFNADTRLGGVLRTRFLAYMASISFAVYVLHIGLTHTWLGSGDFVAKYLKRPLLFLVLIPLAHLSTHYYEMPLTALGRRLSQRLSRARAVTAPAFQKLSRS